MQIVKQSLIDAIKCRLAELPEDKRSMGGYVTGKKDAYENVISDIRTGRFDGSAETSITQLTHKAHQNAVDKGWHDEPRSFGDVIALMHSELSEALEDHRNGRDYTEIYYEGEKPCGIPTELADVVIRIFDACGKYGIDLESAIVEKMAYNATRPQRHGGKVL